MVLNISGNRSSILYANILSSGWQQDITKGWYTQQVNVDGISTSHYPCVDVLKSGDKTTSDAIIEAYSKVIDIATYDGYIIVTASEQPAVDFQIMIKVD